MKSNLLRELNQFRLFLTRLVFGLPTYIWLLIIFFSLFKIILLNSQPIFALGFAGHDDALFINLANSLIKLHWLGHFNNLTLAKGPGYPIWIAFNNLFGLPLLLSQYLLYILACISLIIALKPLLSKHRIFLIILFIVLLFNPASFSNIVNTRVIREAVYPAQTLFIIAFTIGILVRNDRTVKNLIVWVGGLSVFLSWFWLTREEGVWILPFIVPILLFTGFKIWREKLSKWKIKLAILTVPFAFLFLSISIISSINYFVYGIYTAVEFENPEFLEAYGSLTRVKDQGWTQYLPVSRKKMKEIYAVSPTFKKLEPYLDGALGKAWATNNNKNNVYFQDPLDIGGGWFVWAFRDAVAEVGYYKNGKDTMNFYKQLSSEIDTACREKKLDCFGKRKTMMDPFYKEQIDPIIHSIAKCYNFMITLGGTQIVYPTYSSGGKETLYRFSKMTHEPIYIDNNNITVSGWAFSPTEKLNIRVINNKDQLVNYNLEVSDSPDVYLFFSQGGNEFENAKNARFKISTDCKENCFISFIGEKSNLKEKYAFNSTPNFRNRAGSFYVSFDKWDYGNSSTNQIITDKTYILKVSVLNRIGMLYISSLLLLFILSFLIFLFTPFVKQKEHRIFFFINLSLLLAIGARLAILSLIDATSFSPFYGNYFSPFYPLILIFILLNLFSLSLLLKTRWHNPYSLMIILKSRWKMEREKYF